jgi:hypothetical protein
MNRMAAFADWSGLRPMSELEYEKACRGYNTPAVPNEYAWGNAKLFLPHWELEESIVFFYSIFYFPDFMTTDLSYIKEKSAEFSLDEIPNTIYFKKSKQGVSVEWNWGAD